jgi:hypothetical protein
MDMEYEFLVLELRSLPENTSGIIRKSSRTSSKEERFVNGTSCLKGSAIESYFLRGAEKNEAGIINRALSPINLFFPSKTNPFAFACFTEIHRSSEINASKVKLPF